MAARSGGAKSGGALPNLRCFGPKTAIFAQNSPETLAKRPNEGKGWPLHVRLDLTVSKSPLVPFNSTICPRNGPKRCQKAREKLRNVHQHPETKNGPHLGLRGSKTNSEGT